MNNRTSCTFCGKMMPDDPGSYYHKKQCEADFYVRELERVNADIHVLMVEKEHIERQLESARYVGD